MTNLYVNHVEIIRFGRYLMEKKDEIDELLSSIQHTISNIDARADKDATVSDVWNGIDAATFKSNLEGQINKIRNVNNKMGLYGKEILKNGKRYNDGFEEYNKRQVV